MFERFTDESREIILAAQANAHDQGREAAGSEDLLLALAKAPASFTAEVLGELKISDEQVRERLILRLGAGSSGETDRQIRWTAPAKRVLEYSLRQMLERDDPDIAPEHMLLASALVEGSGSREILAELGADFARVKAGVDKRRPR